jgi:hypothetical protein
MKVSLLATVYVVRYSDNTRGGKSRMTDRPSTDVEPRVKFDGAIAFGPTQAALLEAILLSGSGSAVQRQLVFGYVYTWKLAAAMNNRFFLPLVEISRGGKKGGGASVTTRSSGSHRFPPDGTSTSGRGLRGIECDQRRGARRVAPGLGHGSD